eukprot:6586696-Pyramimonas_sp.AAC.1
MALGCFATSQPTDSAFAAPEPKTNAKSPAQGKSGEQMARKQAWPTPAEPPAHAPADAHAHAQEDRAQACRGQDPRRG